MESHESKRFVQFCMFFFNSFLPTAYPPLNSAQCFITQRYIKTVTTLLFHNYSDTVEEALESWFLGGLVVDEFDFYRLHGRDCQYSLADPCTHPTEQTPGLAQGTVMSVTPVIL